MRLLVSVGVAAALCGLTGCAKAPPTPGSTGSGDRPAQVAVVATKDGCAPSPATLAAGPMTFELSNDKAPAVSEIELQQGGKILAEKENLVPGLKRSFSLRLEPGTYTVYCPGARTDKTPFVVTAAR